MYGSGFLLGSYGIYIHSLPCLYVGFGALAGAGLGFGYNSPI